MRLGIDLDGVVVDIITPLLPRLSAICGRELCREDICHYNFETALNLDAEQVAQMWELVSDESIYREPPPVDGAVLFLSGLDSIDWCFVTSRPSWAAKATRDWLEQHGLGDREVIHTEHGKPAALDLELDVFIEDDISTARALAVHGIYVLLMDNPWNRHETLPENCRRVYDWAEVAEELERLTLSRPAGDAGQ